MKNLGKNILTIAAVRTQRLVIDFFDIHTLLSFAIAFCAGYFFQSRFVNHLTNDMSAARWIATLSCIGLVVLTKDFLRRLDDNEKMGRWVNAWIKPVFGIGAVILIFFLDSKTSNMAIENTRAENLAIQIASNIDDSHIQDLKLSKRMQQNQIVYLDSLERTRGERYTTRKERSLNQIANLDVLIAQAESDRLKELRRADALRIATVQDTKTNSMKSMYYGTFLLLIAIAIEILSTGRRKPSAIYDIEFENLEPIVETKQPIALLPAHTETVSTREEEESYIRRHTITERKENRPVEQKPVKIEPTNWEDACFLIVAGKIKLSERQVVKMFPDTSRHKIRSKLGELRRSPSLLAEVN